MMLRLLLRIYSVLGMRVFFLNRDDFFIFFATWNRAKANRAHISKIDEFDLNLILKSSFQLYAMLH